MKDTLQVSLAWLGGAERGQWCSHCSLPSAIKLTALVTFGDETTLRQVVACPQCDQLTWLVP